MGRITQASRKSDGRTGYHTRLHNIHRPMDWNEETNYDDTSDPDSKISDSKKKIPEFIFNKQNPLLIECVLAVMMKHFEFEDLKKFRLVHSAWKSVATGLMKWKYLLQFQYHFQEIPGTRGLQIRPIDWEPKALEFLKNADNFKCDHFCITFQKNYSYSEESIQNQDGVQFNSLFQKVGSNVKVLELEMDAPQNEKRYGQVKYYSYFEPYETNPFLLYLTQNQNLINTLLSNTFPQLTYLAIRIGFRIPGNYENQTKVKFEKFSTFPTVQQLEINFIYKSDSYGPFAEQLFKSAPNAEMLVIKTDEIYERYVDTNCKFVDHIYSKLKLLSKLTSITIKAHGYPSPEVLKLLPAQVKYLDLLLPRISSSWEIESLLEKHAPTLEALFLILPEKPDIVQMPQFPKLERFGLEHFEWNKTPMKFRFINDELFYREQFPALDELSLGNKFQCSEDEALNVWTHFMDFLPEDGFPAESIWKLNVPYIRIKQNVQYSLEAVKLMLRVGKMFPNVREEYFATFEKILADRLDAPKPLFLVFKKICNNYVVQKK